MPKRQRGAQPGNSNARRHGYYSSALSPAMRNAYRRAKDLDDTGLRLEIRLARARIHELLAIEPENTDILEKMLGTMTRMIAVNFKLTHNEEREFGTAMQELLAELMPTERISR
ncbi:MAG: hypothetical protein IVW53_14670 [Chloroflexi bacterium]|nr:hypothetical protein [Chloroflexota bacterium]